MGVSSGLSESDLSKSRCTRASSTAQQSIFPLAGVSLLLRAPGWCVKVLCKRWDPNGSQDCEFGEGEVGAPW